VNPTVRRARRVDCRGIQRAVANSWREAYDGLLDSETLRAETRDPASFYPAERFEHKLDDPTLRFLVATSRSDGAEACDDARGSHDDAAGARVDVAGICNITWGPETTHEFVTDDGAQLRALYLDPAYWRTGIGTSLCDAAVETLHERFDPDERPGTLFVEVLAANDRARGFYEAVGFERFDGREIDLYGETLATDLLRQSVE
jgi:ribosomal protein S18 acetylase RimI-like enzyme